MLKIWCFTKGASAGAKCDHFKLEVRTRVRAHLNLNVQGVCVRPKKGPNSHFVQRACRCGCRSLFAKKLWKCVRKCRCVKFRKSAHLHACEMCSMRERVPVGASRCEEMRPNIHTHHVMGSYLRVD